jgi:prepilin-type N-terminal cleavage/methylation domain-containing protein
MATRTIRRRGGFTLVEMLVVVAIIAILAAILIPVANTALKYARRTSNGAEIADLGTAIERYKSENGGLYPPSFGEAQALGGSYANMFVNNVPIPWRNSLLGRYVMKAYPKATPTDIQALFNMADNLDQGSALHFWLAETFDDPRYPFTGGPNGAGAPRRTYFAFDERRLTQGADNPAFANTFFMWYRPRFAGESYYIYIEAKHYGAHINNNLATDQSGGRPRAGFGTDMNARTPDVSVRPWLKQQVVDTNPANPNNYVNGDTYQLFCAGLDSRFQSTPSNGDMLRKFPCGDTGLDYGGNQIPYADFVDDRDNQTNFSEGKQIIDTPAN